MKRVLFLATLVLIASTAFGQSVCPAPTPGSPHVCLTWNADSTATGGYNVYRASVTGGENYSTPLNSAPLSPSATSYYDTTVAVGSTYFYTVLAIGTGGELSAPSTEVSTQVPLPPTAPTGVKPSID